MNIPLLATMYGFRLHAGTVCEAHQRTKLERLCRYITRPLIATKRLSTDDHGPATSGPSGMDRRM